MPRFFVVAFALVFLGVIAQDAAAQSRRKTERQSTQRTEQQAAPEQRGTEQSPFIVKIQQPEQAQTKSNRATEHGQEQRSDSWFAGWSIGDKIAAIASFAAFLQFVVLVATVWIMVRNNRRQLRAYVLPSGACIRDMIVGRIPEAEIQIKNFGQTPAYNLTHKHGFALCNWPLDEGLPHPQSITEFSRTYLAPTGTFTARRPAPQIFSDAANEQISGRTRALYVYGEIRYKDAFGKSRYTRYRYFNTGLPGVRPGNLLAHQEGNETEES